MTKSDLVAALASRANLSRKAAEQAFDAIFDADSGIIASAVRNGESVVIHRFGTFSRRERPARAGRNPQTKATIQIPARRVAAFRPSKTLKDI